MKPASTIIVAAVLVLSGFVIGELCLRTQTVSMEASPPPSHSPEAKTFEEGSGFRQLDRSIRDSPRETLKAISTNPYVSLTPDQISSLASHIDLTSSSDRRLLLGVSPLELKERLWVECINANIGILPMEKLVSYIEESGIGLSNFTALLDAMASAPDRDSILASDWLRPYLYNVGEHLAARTENLQDLLRQLPERHSKLLKESWMTDWLELHPTAENLGEIMGRVSDLPAPMEIIYDCASELYEEHPSERAAVLAKLTTLPDLRRNRILAELESDIDREDLPSVALYLSSFSSFIYQEKASVKLMARMDAEQKQRLIEQLDAVPDPASVAKLKAALVEKSPSGE